jgi:glucose/arabinose dehydrogenase
MLILFTLLSTGLLAVLVVTAIPALNSEFTVEASEMTHAYSELAITNETSFPLPTLTYDESLRVQLVAANGLSLPTSMAFVNAPNGTLLVTEKDSGKVIVVNSKNGTVNRLPALNVDVKSDHRIPVTG